MNVGLAAKAMLLCFICRTIMFYQAGKCPGHSHCGIITYVHDTFKSEEIYIDQITTGWEQLTVEISYSTQNERYVVKLDE